MKKEIGLLLPGEEERGSLARLPGGGVCVPAGWCLSGNGMASQGSAAGFGLIRLFFGGVGGGGGNGHFCLLL
jgi:hypothetical protein